MPPPRISDRDSPESIRQMNEPVQNPAEDTRLRALIDERNRFTFGLTLLVSLTYTLLMLVIAFFPRWLAVPVWPGSGITSGLFASFLYVLLTFVVMRIWLRRRTAEGSRWRS